MDEKKGIKELTELFVAAGALFQLGKKVKEDGIGTEDIAIVFSELLTKYPVIVAGIDGIKEAVEEAKDLDGAEIAALVAVVTAEIEKVEAV